MGVITDKEMGSKATGADQWFTDPAPRGAGRFLGRVTASGERAFYFRYTKVTGQRDTLAMGPYDPKGREGHLTLAAARQKAAALSKLYREGHRDLREYFSKVEADKLEAMEKIRLEAELEQRRRLTVRTVFERWAATELAPHIGGDGKRIGRKDGGRYVHELFERRVFPSLGNTALADVRKADVLAILDGARADGRLRTANMLLAELKQMFRFAAEREIIEHSPIELIQKKNVGGKDVKRDRVLSDAELRALASQLPIAKLSKRTELGLWLVLATGCRLGELLGATWGDARSDKRDLQAVVDAHNVAQKAGAVQLGFLDLSVCSWHLPTTKNQRNHSIHLSAFATAQFERLAALRETGAGGDPVPWVFPNAAGTGPISVQTFGKQLADRQRTAGSRLRHRSTAVNALVLAGGRWTAHDLRRTASTIMSQLGVPNDVINECLNHIKQGMTGVYVQDRREAEQARAFDALGAKLAVLATQPV